LKKNISIDINMEKKNIVLNKNVPIDINMESKIVGRPKKYTTEEARLRKL
jgi:hypothetical protein